ncbi:MAG: hypothetical protein LKI98_05525 [Bifidobacterium crudilactis]|nr:hypothetical protein [Bifidobacterium crudilactis]MCI1889881.1 hypothetical protein [Bifidobacterium crudilactis]
MSDLDLGVPVGVDDVFARCVLSRLRDVDRVVSAVDGSMSVREVVELAYRQGLADATRDVRETLSLVSRNRVEGSEEVEMLAYAHFTRGLKVLAHPSASITPERGESDVRDAEHELLRFPTVSTQVSDFVRVSLSFPGGIDDEFSGPENDTAGQQDSLIGRQS